MPRFSTILEALQHWVQVLGDGPTFIFRNRDDGRYVLTWNSLYKLSGRFAAILRKDGVGRGSLVVNCLVNSPERTVSDIGVMMAGAVTVSGQCQLADGSDLLRTIQMSRGATLLVDPDMPNSVWNVLKNHITLDDDNNVKSDSLPDLKKVYFVRRVEGQENGDFIGLLEKFQDWFQADDVTADDDVYVFHTSGSTGFSKLVVYTHGCFAGDDREINMIKLFWQNHGIVINLSVPGWISCFFGAQILQGSSRVLCDARAGNPEDMEGFIWRCIQEEKCTIAFLAPMYLPGLEQLASKETAWKLNVIIFGGFPVNQLKIKAGLALAEKVMVVYGITEICVASYLKINDAQDYVEHDAGNIMKGVDVKIVSSENEEKELPTNQLGNILIRQSFMMKGYLNDAEANVAALTKDGFYRTGDLGLLDDRGHLIVEGRGNDAIMRGTYIFYPFWIEERLRQCPGVKDVVIVGVPDPHVNEELCACLQLDTSQVTIEQVCHFVEKDIVASENDLMSPRPRYYLKFESFPRNLAEKPVRRVLKKLAAERLSLS